MAIPIIIECVNRRQISATPMILQVVSDLRGGCESCQPYALV